MRKGTDLKSVPKAPEQGQTLSLSLATGNKDVVMSNISHYGAVSGSCYELSIIPSNRSYPSSGILIDCGLFQGADPLTTTP